VADTARFLLYVRIFAVAQSGGVQKALRTNKIGVNRILETPATIHIALAHYYNENMDRSQKHCQMVLLTGYSLIHITSLHSGRQYALH